MVRAKCGLRRQGGITQFEREVIKSHRIPVSYGKWLVWFSGTVNHEQGTRKFMIASKTMRCDDCADARRGSSEQAVGRILECNNVLDRQVELFKHSLVDSR